MSQVIQLQLEYLVLLAVNAIVGMAAVSIVSVKSWKAYCFSG